MWIKCTKEQPLSPMKNNEYKDNQSLVTFVDEYVFNLEKLTLSDLIKQG